MRALLIAALLLGGAAPAAAQAPAAPPAASSIDAAVPQLDSIFRRYMDESHVPGLVYGVVKDGRLVLVRTMGVQDIESKRPVTPGHPVPHRLDVEGLHRARDPQAARRRPRCRSTRRPRPMCPRCAAGPIRPPIRPRIRVRDLLSHAAGFVTDDPWGDRQTPMAEAEFTRFLRSGVPFQRAPETAYEYSNLGFAILGRIVTNVSGRPFEDYIQAEIMRPLGMASTGYDYTLAPQQRRALGYRWENGAWSREPDLARGAFGAMGGVQTERHRLCALDRLPSLRLAAARRAGAGPCRARHGARAGPGGRFPAARRPGPARRPARRPSPTGRAFVSPAIASSA